MSRAVALFSGGLDSQLALRLTENAGAEVILLHLYTKLSLEKAVSEADYKRRIISLAGKRDVRFLDFSDDFLKIVLNPHFGYGSGVNPCLDCRLLMLKKARQALSTSVSFVVTGEVLGQRPMSQNKNALLLLERKSALEGLILRPLSAKLLTETTPEKRGLVSRGNLLAIQGRSRREQLRLAKEFGIIDYLQPSGGCILTDKNYARRLNDLLAHSERDSLRMEDLLLLKVGRHLRLNKHLKIIVGRNEGENQLLNGLADNLWRFHLLDCAGPLTVAIIERPPAEEEIELIGSITACYSDGAGESSVRVRYSKDGQVNPVRKKLSNGVNEIEVKPLMKQRLAEEGWLI